MILNVTQRLVWLTLPPIPREKRLIRVLFFQYHGTSPCAQVPVGSDRGAAEVLAGLGLAPFQIHRARFLLEFGTAFAGIHDLT
jgi:hypothetical protein